MRISSLILLLAASAAASAGNDWSIEWHSIDGGGTMESGGGPWSLQGTIGQHDASAAHAFTGGIWRLSSGFWALIAEFRTSIFSDGFEAD